MASVERIIKAEFNALGATGDGTGALFRPIVDMMSKLPDKKWAAMPREHEHAAQVRRERAWAMRQLPVGGSSCA